MFSVNQKRAIADAVQKILRNTNHPELPVGEIQFNLSVKGGEAWSWAEIRNNGAVLTPDATPWNELQDKRSENRAASQRPCPQADLVLPRKALPAGTKIEYLGMEAEIVSDDGGDMVEVMVEGRRQTWHWYFDGAECTVVADS